MKKKLVIIGGGIAGLAAAWYAQKAGIPYTLLEESNRFGGLIHSESVGDFLIEYGPDAFITRKAWALELAKDLGLDDALIPVNKTPERIYILTKSGLVPLPDGLGLLVPTKLQPFLASPLLSWWGKLRLLMDYLIPAKNITEDESLAQFITRRMGKEALEILADPLLAGVYNAEMDNQSILATFPQYRALEQKYGSLIKGMRSAQKTASEDSGLMSFRCGMGQLVDTLVAQLTGNLQLNSPVSKLEAGDKIRISVGEGLRPSPTKELLEADALILATPAKISAQLLVPIAPESAESLKQIRYAGIGSVSLGYQLKDIPRALDAYGVVIPSSAKRPIDGMQWNSAKWGKRAPDENAVIRVFFGGPHTRFMLEKTEDELLAIVREELRQIMGISAEPLFYRIGKWENAYPQYDVAHVERVAAIESVLPDNIALAGNAYYGVGIPDTVKTAKHAIEKLKA